MNAIRRTGLVALALSAGAGAAKAQATSDTLDVHANRAVSASEQSNTNAPCGINDGSPYQLNSARVYLNTVSKAGSKESEKDSHLRDAVRVLTTDADKIGNEAGRNWLLARAYYEWLQRPSVPANGITTRGALGFTTDTDKPIDLLAAEDSALAGVEAHAAGCNGPTVRMRRALFARYYNPAVTVFDNGEGNVDSTIALTNRAIQIWKTSPNVYNLRASAAMKKNDPQGAIAAYRSLVELAGSDTSFAKLKQTAIYNSAILQLNLADQQTGDQKKATLAQARADLETVLKSDPNNAAATQALARIAAASGDVKEVQSIYGEMAANPAKFSDIQLFEAGANAARDKQYEQASQLLELGLQKNPYHRDALYNLAIAYQNQKLGDKEAAAAQRLLAVDPDNKDNWVVLSNSYRLRGNASSDVNVKLKMADSATSALSRGTGLKVRVQLAPMTSQGAKRTIQAQVQNLGTAPASYTLKFDFLDASGNVVTSQTASVGPVAPNTAAPVKVQAEGASIVGFRYAPLP